MDSGISDQLEAQYLQWRPDFDFADAAKFIKPGCSSKTELALIERLFGLCGVESQRKAVGAMSSEPHFARFLLWLDKQVKRFDEPDYPLVEDSASLLHLGSEMRQQMIHECLERIQCIQARPLGAAIWRSYKHMVDIIEGRTNFLDLLLKDGILQQIYDWINDLQDLTDLFALLGNTRPQLKILEVGAGTGGLTSKILQSLLSEHGEHLCQRYTFSDISSGFFVQVQDRFKDYSNVEYKVLDIAQDPLQQWFREGEYDLIVASNVLHATPVLVETLSNCRKLLQPNGYLFMQELSPKTKGTNFVMGLFFGWWLGEKDGRVDEPFISPEEWDDKLCEAGFDSISSVTLDGERPCHFNANIIAQPTTKTAFPKRLTLLTNSQELGPIALATREVLEQQGYSIDHCIWGNQYPVIKQDLISFVDIEGGCKPLLRDIFEDDLSKLLQLIDRHSQSNLLWLTKPAQINPEDPHHAQILGVARTARTELGMDFATMELEHAGPCAASAIAGVMKKLQRARQVDGDLDPDMEYAWKNGTIHVSRFHWFLVRRALADAAPASDVKHLVVGQLGMLQSLQWRKHALEAMNPEEVRIRTTAVGMNFKDILHALGIIRTDAIEGLNGAKNTMGCEATGFITTVGSAVKNLQVGDRVMCLDTGKTGFSTEMHQPAACCVKIPDRLSNEEAVTMPVAYYTGLHCLVDKANLKKGQSILIHGAAGAVGIASIHVASMLGAEIYVTTGTEKKAEFLISDLGVPRQRIFNSRDASFADSIMKATTGNGVDVVLNSLSGDLLHASWKCIAAGGSMIEIGQRDVVGYGQLAMSHFAVNRTFCCVDVSKLVSNIPRTQSVLEQIIRLYELGHIYPIRPKHYLTLPM